METVKIINFAGKKWTLKNTAYSIVAYQLEYGTDMFDDYRLVADEIKKKEKDMKIGIVLGTITKIFYILQNQVKTSYQDFMEKFTIEDITNVDEIKALTIAIGQLFDIKKKKQQTCKKKHYKK